MLRASLETPRCRPCRSETEGQPLQRPGLDVRHDGVLPRRVRRALRDAGAARLFEASHVRALQAGRRTFEGVLRAHAPASVGPKHVGAYLDLRAKNGRPAQGNRERARLATCFTSLIRTGKAASGSIRAVESSGTRRPSANGASSTRNITPHGQSPRLGFAGFSASHIEPGNGHGTLSIGTVKHRP